MTVTEPVVFIAQKKISSKRGSTSGLFCHLKSKHNLSVESKDQSCTSKKAKIDLTNCNVKKESVQSIVSQLVAVDSFSIHSTGKSKFIPESLSAKDFRLPCSDSSIINLNHSENDDIQKEIKA